MAVIMIRPLADFDIDEQADYYSKIELKLARRFLFAVARAFQTLAAMPAIGSPWPTSNPKYLGVRVGRIKGFTKHLIFYRPIEGGIEVIRLLHGARDAARIFGKKEDA